MVEIKNLYKSFNNKEVINNVSFTFTSGTTGILGPSGVGKTTVLRLLADLEEIDSGSISGLENKKLAYVFQEDRILNYLSFRKNIEFVNGSLEYGYTLAKKFHMEEEWENVCYSFSGGMKRRVAIIRALSIKPDILLLDEPFTGLDKELKKLILEELKKNQERITILVTHEKEDIKYLQGEILYLS